MIVSLAGLACWCRSSKPELAFAALTRADRIVASRVTRSLCHLSQENQVRDGSVVLQNSWWQATDFETNATVMVRPDSEAAACQTRSAR